MNYQPQYIPPQYSPMYNPNQQIIQDRLNSISQPNYMTNFGQTMPNMQQAQPIPAAMQAQAGQFSCRAVSGIEEARAAMIDAFGVYVFADLAGGKFYTKQIANDGTSQFRTYALETPSENAVSEQIAAPNYDEKISQLSIKVEDLEDRLTKFTKGGAVNDSAANANVKNGK